MHLSEILPEVLCREVLGYSSVPPELNHFGLFWFYQSSSNAFTANTSNEVLLLYLIILFSHL